MSRQEVRPRGLEGLLFGGARVALLVVVLRAISDAGTPLPPRDYHQHYAAKEVRQVWIRAPAQ
jgi:hypothetical protein